MTNEIKPNQLVGSDTIDLGKIFFLVLERWYIFLISILLGGAGAFLYLHYKTPVYRVNTTLLVDEENSANPASSSELLEGFGLQPARKNLENQINILKSRNLIRETLKQLPYNLDYYTKGYIRKASCYPNNPILVVADSGSIIPHDLEFAFNYIKGNQFEITIVDEDKKTRSSFGRHISFKTLEESYLSNHHHNSRNDLASLDHKDRYMFLEDSASVLPQESRSTLNLLDFDQLSDLKPGKEITTRATFGKQISIKNMDSFSILPNPDYWSHESKQQTIYFKFREMNDLISKYRDRLNVGVLSEDGTIVNLSLEGSNKQKDIDFLNKLISVFQTRNLDRKNQEAVRIIGFIDEQLIGISDSLMIAERKLQQFRSKNRVMDVSAQGQQIIDQAVKLEDEKARLELESNYFEYLASYLSSDNTQENPILPATMDISDPLLTQLVQNLAELQTEYYGGSVGEKNPMKNYLLLKINNIRQSLQETLKNVRHANSLAKKENAEQIRNLNAQATGLPAKERKLLGIERKFKLNDVLYTYLLERRAEAQIQKASNIPDNELIDFAEAEQEPIAPKAKNIAILAFLISFGLPLIILLILDHFDNKIASEEELKRLTTLPIAGHIPHNDKKHQTIVLDDPFSNVTESFRNIRSRMQFFTQSIASPVILVTSSMPSEGKSFTSLNLASVYSLIGKKTVLVGFDLRKPKLYHDFGLKNEKGISTWLIGKDSMDDIVQPTKFDNLDLITAGPIPPNPGELASSDKMQNFINQLKERYEYIIIDSAPIGTVADSFAITGLVDATLLIVRHKKSLKDYVKNTVAETIANGVKGMSILINDLDTQSLSYRRSYSYSYGYGYKSDQK